MANDNELRVFCDSCSRCRDLDVDALVNKYGSDMELPEIGKRARCGECGISRLPGLRYPKTGPARRWAATSGGQRIFPVRAETL